MSEELAHEFGRKDSERERKRKELEVLQSPPDVQIEERREAPNVLGIMDEITEEAPDNANASEEGQGQILLVRHPRDRDQDTGDEPGGVASKESRKEGAFEREVHRFVVALANDTNGCQDSKDTGEPERKVKLLTKCASLAEQRAAKWMIANDDAGDARNNAKADEQRDQKAFHLY